MWYSVIMNINIYNLLLALSLNELIHVCSEAWAAREKVSRLDDYISKRKHKEMAIKVDTRAKSYAFSIAIFLILVPLFYIILQFIGLTNELCLALSAGTLILSYVVGFVWMDKYHVDMEKITSKFKK